jgi:ABC-2 type transport system permease protein
MTSIAISPSDQPTADLEPVPLTRVMGVELRKMFDTRAGFWLIASIVITGLLSMVLTVLLAPDADLTYYTFAKAVGFPMTVILPIIAVLAITGEWSQRTGLTTFTLVPHRARIIGAKVIASVFVGVAAMLFALVTGVVGNVIGTAFAGTDLVWDVSVAHAAEIVLGSLSCLLAGTALGLLFRSSPVALVAYFVSSLVLPTLFGILASSQAGFKDIQPWVDLNYAQAALFEGSVSSVEWAHFAATVAIWLVLPGLLGLRAAIRSEVK